MNFDFSAILVLLTLVTGGIGFIDWLVFAKRRQQRAAAEQHPELPFIVAQARAFFPIFLIVLLLRSFLFEPFRIPSASMMPTLLIGDFILVNKYQYGLRLPVLHDKIVANETPARGDIIVFRYPRKPSIAYIKRVVGVPGDKVEYYNKMLYINGEQQTQRSEGSYRAKGAGIEMAGAILLTENLSNRQHQILIDKNRPTHYYQATVPEGHYFVLGDNRDNSTDSRFWGFVADEHLLGRAVLIWMNWDLKNGGIDFSRMGTIIN